MAQALAKREIHNTMHDASYIEVFNLIERVRKDLAKGEIAREITCPVCGLDSVFISQREPNIGHVTLVCMCINDCFSAWE